MPTDPATPTTYQTDLWTLRGLIQKYGWAKFLDDVRGIMAEQADKVPANSEQDKALFSAANILAAPPFVQIFGRCGRFDYRGHFLTPEEFRPLLTQYAPVEENR